MKREVRLRVVIPHFFRRKSSANNEQVSGYGSDRSEERTQRGLALARCLGSALSLNRSSNDWILNIAEKAIETTPQSEESFLSEVKVDIHVFVTGEDWLDEVIDLFSHRIQTHNLQLSTPRYLPLEAVRRTLFDKDLDADYVLYLEDDLIINDNLFMDKHAWFLKETDFQYVLMPHRVEYAVANTPKRLFVDGPIKPENSQHSVWSKNESTVCSGLFCGNQFVEFVKALNPHSGSFCLGRAQIEKVKNLGSWPPSLFIGALETAATGMVLDNFTILKPRMKFRDFLLLEHGMPSFLSYITEFPHK